jgi:two-component system sensor histidine kinase CiaH
MSKLQRFKNFVKTATARLSLSYLAIIMLMSIGFSVVFYNTSSRELGRQGLPPALFDDHGGQRDNSGSGNNNPSRQEIQDFLETRIVEGRRNLLHRLILLNILALAAGGALSYYLARRTLQPIEENMEAQAQFVSDASHELRTPLTAMQTTNEVALRRDKLSTKDAKDIIAQNIEEVVKLKALTDGLLNLARQDSTTIPKTAVSLQDIALEAMNRVIAQAQSKDISVEDNVADIKVLGNAASLTQAVVILLDNAIKYSAPGTTVYLSSEKKGKHGYLHVRDEGPGIRPFDLRKIFDRFYRADQSRGKKIVEGHGIGLSLAKKIIEQQGGEITAASAIGKGSTFTIRMPLA